MNNMDTRNSTLYSILTARCPRCHEGKMFPAGTLYSPSFMKMNQTCSCCGQAFEPEPGYYFGAMFISYAINTGLLVTVWVAMSYLLEEITTGMIIGAVALTVLGFLPLTFRWSRVLWIYIFVRYDKRYDDATRVD